MFYKNNQYLYLGGEHLGLGKGFHSNFDGNGPGVPVWDKG